jgi:serine/threonine protein kinase
MHQHGLTHMDLKPSNVVITNDFDAVLIDLSGIGGITQARKQNDIWAFGRILFAMADVCRADDEKQLLRSVAQAATRPIPRIPLHDAMASLSE